MTDTQLVNVLVIMPNDTPRIVAIPDDPFFLAAVIWSNTKEAYLDTDGFYSWRVGRDRRYETDGRNIPVPPKYMDIAGPITILGISKKGTGSQLRSIEEYEILHILRHTKFVSKQEPSSEQTKDAISEPLGDDGFILISSHPENIIYKYDDYKDEKAIDGKLEYEFHCKRLYTKEAVVERIATLNIQLNDHAHRGSVIWTHRLVWAGHFDPKHVEYEVLERSAHLNQDFKIPATIQDKVLVKEKEIRAAREKLRLEEQRKEEEKKAEIKARTEKETADQIEKRERDMLRFLTEKYSMKDKE